MITITHLASLAILFFFVLDKKSKDDVEAKFSLVLTIFLIFLIIRIIEVIFYRNIFPIYVIEKIIGISILIVLADFRLFLLGKPTLTKKSVFLYLLFILITLIPIMICFNIPSYLLLLLSYYLVNSFFEEGLFRGILFSSLKKSLKKTITAIFIQSALFSIWHIPHVIFNLDVYALGYLFFGFLVGIYFGYIRIYSGGLWLPILFHTLWNSVQSISCFTPSSIYGELLLFSPWIIGITSIPFLRNAIQNKNL